MATASQQVELNSSNGAGTEEQRRMAEQDRTQKARRKQALHLLDNVNQNISATAVRQAVAAKRPIKKFVPESVEEYIKKEGLYGG